MVDLDAATTAEVTTKSGAIVDLNNLPGKTRRDLMRKGELSSGYSLPANMPGKKLVELRKKQEEQRKKDLGLPNRVPKVGDLIMVKDVATEVIKVEKNNKGTLRVLVKTTSDDGQEKVIKKWIGASKLLYAEEITQED